jgi:hypothetical protein
VARSEREEAQRRRADDRRRRRERDADGAGDANDLMHDLREAGKTAAAAATVGAAMAAVRALADRSGGDESETAEATEPEPAIDASDPEPAGAVVNALDEEPAEPRGEDRQWRRQPAEGASPSDVERAVETARDQLAALLGKEPEAVAGLERTPEGWTMTLEVVELPRIPSSTDVLASYEVMLDDDLRLVRYRRGRRYHRSQAEGSDRS